MIHQKRKTTHMDCVLELSEKFNPHVTH